MPVEQWFFEIPIVTRTYATLAVATSLLCQLKWINPLQLYFNYELIVAEKQVTFQL